MPKTTFLLCTLLFAYSTIFAKEDSKPMNHAVLEMGVPIVVNGVNMITGDYLDSSVDLVIPGPEPLILERTYISANYGTEKVIQGWHHNHDSWMEMDESFDVHSCTYKDITGRKLSYRGGVGKHNTILDFRQGAGYTNCTSGVISARNNPKNSRINYIHRDEWIDFKDSSGSVGVFEFNEEDDQWFPLALQYKPDLRKIKYTHDEDRRLTSVELLCKHGNDLLSSLHFNYTKIDKKEEQIEIEANDGRKAYYKVKKCKKTDDDNAYLITQVIKPNAPSECYEYDSESRRKMRKKILPDQRCKWIDYYTESTDVYGEHVNVKRTRAFKKRRVKEVQAPVGVDANPITTHYFYYTMDKDHTKGFSRVRDAYGNVTRYDYDESDHLTTIAKYRGTGKEDSDIYSRECYVWGDEKSNEAGYLQAKYILDGQNASMLRALSYDNSGNIIKDTFFGNISGNSPLVILEGRSAANNGCESYSTAYAYTASGSVPFLMSSETEDNGKGALYTYLDDTELVVSKLVTDHGAIKVRYFYEYDNNGVVVKAITDDGTTSSKDDLTGVSQRAITYTYPRRESPIGLPQRIDEMYLDLSTGQEKLIKRVINHHTIEGWIAKQEVYDANGVFACTTERTFDAHGNVLVEKDALGQITERKYDANDNLIYERGPSGKSYFIHTYDFANRLIRTDECHADGEILSSSFQYNYRNNRISSTDAYGNKTEFRYDEFSRPIATLFPPIYNENSDLVTFQTSCTYDIYGNIVTACDQRGDKIETIYNAHGKPLSLKHPDGSIELFQYNLDGTLKQQTATTGAITYFTYDVFGREIRKEIRGLDGAASVTSATYNVFHMLTSTDAMGVTTTYRYDGAGRVIEMCRADLKTEYEYDSLGRRTVTREWYSDADNRVKREEFDLLNRVTSETIEEGFSGEILRFVSYMYDADNNVISKTVEAGAGQSTTYTEYNASKQPIKEVDPLGNATLLVYNHDAVNSYGQHILEVTRIDPLGNQTVTTFNTWNKPGMIVRKNSLGDTIAKKEFFYCGIGDCQHVIETVITPGSSDRKTTSQFIYDAHHRLCDIIEASGTPLQKHTSIRYNAHGQKESIIKPDGTVLQHTYDGLGRLASFRASDNTFDYTYIYDANNNPVTIADQINRTELKRTYDPKGRLLKEVLGNGNDIQYEYDPLNRPTQVKFPDGSQVSYRYDAMNLLDIVRLSIDGETTYKHTYRDYDQIGHHHSAIFAGDIGQERCSYDLSGRLESSEAPGFSEKVVYDAAGNITSVELGDDVMPMQSKFTYDSMYQLGSETGQAEHTYVHDSVFNCVSRDGESRTVNVLNQLVQQGDLAFTYDKNGNRKTKTQGSLKTYYAYDAQDRLVAVTQGDVQWKYTYDAFNRRLSKEKRVLQGNQQVAVSAEHYLYQGQNEVGICEAGKLKELRVLGIGKGAEIGASVAFEFDDKMLVPIHDHNGNVVSLIDESSHEIVERYRYSAFGEEKVFDQNGTRLLESAQGNCWRFSSKRVDPETGFVYFGRRHYDPVTARWISPDPIGFDGGPNLYAYVLNNPCNHIDLYGLVAERSHSLWCRVKSFVNGLSRAISRVPGMKTIGTGIESAARHLVPVPGLERAVRSVGNFLAGKGLGSQPIQFQCASMMVPGNTNGRIGYGFETGVLNDKQDTSNSAVEVSQSYGGAEVYVSEHVSDSLAYSLVEILMQKLGFVTDSVRTLARDMRAGLSKFDNFHMSVHSQGGLIFHLAASMLTPGERARLSVTTYGTAKIIDAKELGLRAAENVVIDRDLIPFISDPVGYTRACNSDYGNLTIIKSDAVFAAHSINQYKTAIMVRGMKQQINNQVQ